MTLLNSRIGTKFGDVQFGVQKSYRYHIARQKHYEFLVRITSFAIIVLTACSGIAIIEWPEQISRWYGLFAPVLVIVLSVFEIVNNTSAMATTHKLLAHQFNQLDIKMVASDRTDDSTASLFQVHRQEIETAEPPDLHVLNVVIHNELCQAIGNTEDLYHIGVLRKVLRQWIDWPPQKWQRLEEYQAQKLSAKSEFQTST